MINDGAAGCRISIITVTYNSSATVSRTIESVLSQSVPPMEYLIIDGASKDDTVAVAEGYRKAFEEKEIAFRVRPAGIEDGTVLRSIFMTNESGYNESEVDFPVSFGRIRVHMSKHSSVVLKAIKETEGDLT